MLEERKYTHESIEGLKVTMTLSIKEGQVNDDSILVTIPDCDQEISINLAEAHSLISILQKCLDTYDQVDAELHRGKE